MKRALRADAERNRRQILEVAQAVFAAEGLSVPIDEIARRAGLGIGTVYRHFPTKEALFSAIVVSRIRDAADEARSALDADASGEAFFALLARLVSDPGKKKHFIDALTTAGVDMKEIALEKGELHRHLEELLRRAQREGSIRHDVSMKEIWAALTGALAAVTGLPEASRERVQKIVFDGLRPAPPARATARKRPPSRAR